MAYSKAYLLSFLVLLLFLASPAAAFGAGNIASISRIEGQNWRHGDIEDMLKTVAFLRGHKWTSMMIKRVYFGNWLRDYSQAIDVGTLKGVQADTIRILIWVLAFMSFGYATEEFEVTAERLGTYRPEEHIDNPKDYADNEDARKYDPRLRPPVNPEELAIDPQTGMKNYIANESGGWATSTGYIRHSFSRSIHFGRVYTSGPSGQRGREEDLCEALRCLGQGLHCMEDFGAHSNYTELALRELGFSNVFTHTGTATEINLHGKRVYPIVTGTFGGVDFLHSVVGEATDHITQSEVEEMSDALGNASDQSKKIGVSPEQQASGFTDLLSKVPGTDHLCREAIDLQAASDAQARQNARGGEEGFADTRANEAPQFAAPPGAQGGPPGPGVPGMSQNFDPQATIAKIYPILQFRDRVVRSLMAIVSKIPGLEKLIETISERITIFIMSLLAPYIQPIIKAVSKSLKQGSTTVVDASANHQYEPWTNPQCTDPTHSLLSKDHFSNTLNAPAGHVASVILQYTAPRVIYAWENPGVPVDEVLDDIVRAFHHPAIRDQHLEIHRNMFSAVERWVQGRPDQGRELNTILSSESVKAGHNHVVSAGSHPSHGGHGKVGGSPLDQFTQKFSSGGGIPGLGNIPGLGSIPGMSGGKREGPYGDEGTMNPPAADQNFQPQPSGNYMYEAPGPTASYGGQQYQPSAPAGFVPNDPYAYPTAYQQGYEIPYEGQQQPPPAGEYGQQPGHHGQQHQPSSSEYGGQQGYGYQ
ncbi:MAG: hypothetical protein M1821_000458 [Bathelium mastoideum]|nr:MAG: hypothetical protein M1821_000458 [Bathelium mastoideum]KAI9686273.1 MAG: hypothetical protein M1822_003929 [Bathelium mastoideum]